MEEWKECKLGDLCIDNKGSYGIAASAVPYSENLYTYLRITDINDDGTLNKSDLKSVADENAEQYILQPNDIVFARTGGSTGRNYFYDGSDGVFVYAGFLIKFSIDPSKVNPKYIKYFCLSQEYKNWVYSFNTGSTRGNINAQTYANMPVILPPRSQQDLLVKTLSSLDDKIELNNKINTNLEQQAEALFKNWFVDFAPFGGKMPEGWKVGKLGDFVEIKRGGSPRPIQKFLSDEGYRWLKISDVTSLSAPFVLNVAEHIKEEGLSKTVFLMSGSLVLSNSATPGIPKILDLDTCIHDGWLYFPKSQLSNEYLYLLFKEIRPQLLNLGNGSIFTNLKTDILKNFEVSLPSTETLSKFQNIIKPIFEKVLATQREIKQLETLRDTLLPKLMNGEIALKI